MKKIFYFLQAAMIFGMFSCENNHNESEDISFPPTLSVLSPQLNTINEYDEKVFPIFNNATYDNLGRITSYEGEFGKYSYSYQSDKIVMQNSNIMKRITFNLSNGLISSAVEQGQRTEYFEYNFSKQLIKRTCPDEKNAVTEYTWMNGNIIKVESSSSTNDYYSSIDIRYNTAYTVKNALVLTIPDYSFFHLYREPWSLIDPILMAEGYYGNSVPQNYPQSGSGYYMYGSGPSAGIKYSDSFTIDWKFGESGLPISYTTGAKIKREFTFWWN